MPTTAIHPGCAFCQVCTYDNWGDVTEREAALLGNALVDKFTCLARAATGDESITWHPYTSEILYECWGRTDEHHYALDPRHAWPDNEVDFVGILGEAAEWVGEHAEEIIGE